MKRRLGKQDIIFPIPAALVVSGNENTSNIITVAWIGIVSSTPPTIGISLRKNRYSLELIRESREFTVNIPSSDYYKETDYCGIVTGKERNKFTDTSLTPLPGTQINTPIIKECPYNIECRVTQEIELGDYILILGEIVETHIDEDKIEVGKKIDISKVNPLVYCATVREYWDLGQKLGNAFQAGKGLKEEDEDGE